MGYTEYLWDPLEDNVIGEYDENGDRIVSYTTEPELYGNVISQHRADSGESYHHHDAQGNTIRLTDQSGNVTDTYAYNAFGETVARTGTTTNPFGFCGALGYYANPETGDHYVRARMYRARNARWLSGDPIGSITGNLFVYVLSNPLNAVDPSGLLKKVLVKADPPAAYVDLVSCGKYWQHYTWDYDDDGLNGLIVQRVTLTSTGITPCTKEDDPTAFTKFPFEGANRESNVDCSKETKSSYFYDYIEMWRVKDGKVYIDNIFSTDDTEKSLGKPQTEGNGDVFAFSGTSTCSHGSGKQVGQFFFVPDGKWEKFQNDLLTWFKKGKHGVPNAGSLYSACNDGEAEALYKKLRAAALKGSGEQMDVVFKWNCCSMCPPCNLESTLSTTPRKGKPEEKPE